MEGPLPFQFIFGPKSPAEGGEGSTQGKGILFILRHGTNNRKQHLVYTLNTLTVRRVVGLWKPQLHFITHGYLVLF